MYLFKSNNNFKLKDTDNKKEQIINVKIKKFLSTRIQRGEHQNKKTQQIHLIFLRGI